MGAQVSIINRLGQDDFAKMTLDVWEESGVTPYIQQSPDDYTRAAYILSKRSLATMLRGFNLPAQQACYAVRIADLAS